MRGSVTSECIVFIHEFNPYACYSPLLRKIMFIEGRAHPHKHMLLVIDFKREMLAWLFQPVAVTESRIRFHSIFFRELEMHLKLRFPWRRWRCWWTVCIEFKLNPGAEVSLRAPFLYLLFFLFFAAFVFVCSFMIFLWRDGKGDLLTVCVITDKCPFLPLLRAFVCECVWSTILGGGGGIINSEEGERNERQERRGQAEIMDERETNSLR